VSVVAAMSQWIGGLATGVVAGAILIMLGRRLKTIPPTYRQRTLVLLLVGLIGVATVLLVLAVSMR